MKSWHYLPPAQIVGTGIPGLVDSQNAAFIDKKIYLRYSLGPTDWYMAEYSYEKDLFYGCAVISDALPPEWGYIPHAELQLLRIPPVFEVERDLRWTPMRAGDISRIARWNLPQIMNKL